MTAFTVAVLLLLLYLTPFGGPIRTKNTDIFAPERVVAFIHIFSTIPFLLFASWDYEGTVHVLVRNHPSVDSSDAAFLRYGAVQALGFASLIWGIRRRSLPNKLSKLPPTVAPHSTPKRIFVALLFLAVAIVALHTQLTRLTGGLSALLSSMQSRTHLHAGLAYLTTPLVFSILLFVAILTYSFRHRDTLGKRGLLLVVALIAAAYLSLRGERFRTIQLLAICLFTWHYCVRGIKAKASRTLPAAAALAVYLVAVPLMRAEGAFDRYSAAPVELLTDSVANIHSAIKHVSYVDHYLLISSHFGLENLWLGASYIDLVFTPIPSSIYPNKPPVDDGVYLRTIAEGYDVTPSLPYNELFQSSWPPETLGIMFMNFWFPGVAVGMAVLGILIRSAYNYLIRTGPNLFAACLYAYVVLFLHLTNLRIVGFVMYALVSGIACIIFFGAGRGLSKPGIAVHQSRMNSIHAP